MKASQTKYLCLILITCLYSQALSAKNDKSLLFPRTELEFYILESELTEGKYLEGNVKDYGFIKYQNNELPLERPIDDRMLTLRAKFVIDSTYLGQDIYLVLLPAEYPYRVYFNQNEVLIRGDYKYGYTNRMHYSEAVLLPSDKTKYGEVNEIAFEIYPKQGEVNPLSEIFISNAQDATKYVFYRNLLGPKLITALALSGFVFFLFYLITYISRREYQKQHFLFFSFMNLFFVISYINNIFSYNFSHTFVLEKIARSGFPLFIFVGICFLLDYTGVFKNKKTIKQVLALIYLPSLIFVLLPSTTAGIIRNYNSYTLIPLLVGNLILLSLTLLFLLKEKSRKSAFLFGIFLLNIFAGFYDGYYFAVLQTKPFVLLTPITVFGINLIIFIILALDHSKLYHLAVNSSKKLEKLNTELELLVEKRTQKTIEYANKLEEANNTKDKFFSIIAHDLKNPFNTLIGYADVLKSDFRDYGPDEIHQHLNVIYDTSVNGYNLLENLLKWSQSQTDKILFEPRKVNLHEVTQLCIDDVENQSQFKDIDVINKVQENFHIIADINLLKTILRNLINNAVKFTDRNGMVSVSCFKDKNDVVITVEDTGVGIKKKDIQKMFKIDQVTSKPGTNRERGSGLGLILCKEFVEKHGGTIWVESEPDVGSVFKFTIPKIIQMN